MKGLSFKSTHRSRSHFSSKARSSLPRQLSVRTGRWQVVDESRQLQKITFKKIIYLKPIVIDVKSL